MDSIPRFLSLEVNSVISSFAVVQHLHLLATEPFVSVASSYISLFIAQSLNQDTEIAGPRLKLLELSCAEENSTEDNRTTIQGDGESRKMCVNEFFDQRLAPCL